MNVQYVYVQEGPLLLCLNDRMENIHIILTCHVCVCVQYHVVCVPVQYHVQYHVVCVPVQYHVCVPVNCHVACITVNYVACVTVNCHVYVSVKYTSCRLAFIC